jgi:hypothetical protein
MACPCRSASSGFCCARWYDTARSKLCSFSAAHQCMGSCLLGFRIPRSAFATIASGQAQQDTHICAATPALSVSRSVLPGAAAGTKLLAATLASTHISVTIGTPADIGVLRETGTCSNMKRRLGRCQEHLKK